MRYYRQCVSLLLLCLVFVFFTACVSFAAEAVTGRTGTLKVTQPDGTTITVTKDEPLPGIVSGSVIEILSGSADFSPTVGFIQVVAGNSVATVDAGSSMSASSGPAAGQADFLVRSGSISVVTGNTSAKLDSGDEAVFSLNARNGVVSVHAVSGTVLTITAEVRVNVPEGAIARINVDASTRMVHVVSERGTIMLASLDGRSIAIAGGTSFDAAGSSLGVIQSFGEQAAEGVFEEEPTEPEIPEASPFRP